MVGSRDNGQQTKESFAAKWKDSPQILFDPAVAFRSGILSWVLARNGFVDVEQLRSFLNSKTRILDAGCGNGRMIELFCSYASADVEIVGIDINADIAQSNLGGKDNVIVYSRDLLNDLSDLGGFDFIYCQEVLHHTTDPVLGVKRLAKQLNPGGILAVYVYRVKAPLREFSDDLVRSSFESRSWEDAYEEASRITALGKTLSEITATVSVPDIPVLGIREGQYSLQRFFYHFFLKCFWSPELSVKDNIAINLDWFHPSIATRHTLDEVRDWMALVDLDVIHAVEDEYGITVHGQRTKEMS